MQRSMNSSTVPEGARVLVSGPLRLDIERRELQSFGRTYHLTPKECQLLVAFIRHKGQVLTRQFLMREVWQTGYVADTRTLEVHVHWIRRKIEPERTSPSVIHTVRGVGYMFQPPDDPPWTVSDGAEFIEG